MTEGMTATRRGTSVEVRHGTGVSFGTFGELLQGALPGSGEDFLVTLPIARWSTARITLFPGSSELRVSPEHKRKSAFVARSALDRFGAAGFGGTLEITSDLPEGKGMASSSADLVATVRAVGDALGRVVGPRETELLLRGVEPTDGLMHPGIVAFHHRRVALCRALGAPPPLTVIGVDEGGQVDTVDFNTTRPPITAAERREYGVLLDDVGSALARGDLAAVGRVATRSAELNQRRCHKRLLDPLIAISRDADALGVAVAHSGTMVGVLVSRTDPDHDAKVDDIRAACRELGAPISVDHTTGTVPATPHNTFAKKVATTAA
ncbi:GHMP family kinase ATP-binding protein [Saccharothrix luteola]|uniref:GHMP family kinase ATP-binding protein n=1 Tax=Saccharothrix luteola TaxID=2893018 RepID=UPI001E312513|nr:kinase [Saccharothrix luteola]MCC8250841.1 kinase [Saccharothrix luteola]